MTHLLSCCVLATLHNNKYRTVGADKGCPKATVAHIREIFGRMGFTDREMVALLGAHALGRCHTENR